MSSSQGCVNEKLKLPLTHIVRLQSEIIAVTVLDRNQ